MLIGKRGILYFIGGTIAFLSISFIVLVSYRYMKPKWVKSYYKEVKKDHPKVYCYETYSGSLNAVYYVDNLDETKKLVNFYDKIMKTSRSNVILRFPIQTMAFNKPLFLIRYVRDSTVAEVVDFNKECWGKIQGYVDARTIHFHPPPDSLLEKRSSLKDEKEELNKKTIRSVTKKERMKYGIQCW